MSKYMKFVLMILVSTIVMFALMYVNVEQFSHIFFSQTRLYMAILMGAAMAIIMFLFMMSMYQNKKANLAMIAASVLIFILSFWLVRSQATIGDISFMRAMIPHHSIAILNSKNAKITDPRVRELADQIIKSQEEEIAKMKALIADLEARK